MYLYENPDWPKFIIDKSIIKPAEEMLLREQCFLDGIMSIVPGKGEYAQALAESLEASWAIEGISLSDEDIFSSIAKRLGIPYPVKSTKAYYDGIADVLCDAVENHEPLTIERLLSWHKKISVETPGIKRGLFRDDSVYIMSGRYKNSEIIYEAPPASKVGMMMDEFISFVNSSLYSDPVMAAIAHYYLVAIHPFEDGNGRVARIVSDYVMNRSNEGFPSVFVSSEIKKKQSEYYSILNRISAGSSMDITEWVAWFLERMIDSYVAAIARIQDSFRMKAFWERAREHDLNARQLEFLGKVLNEDWKGAITAKKYAAITECHPDTANRDLRKLVGYGLIVKEEGGSKNTHYSVLIDPC